MALHPRLGALAALALVLIATPSMAQVPPSESEIASYTGLFAAAQKGEAAAIRKLAKPETVNARDAHNRTPYLVATHAKNIKAMEALVAAGADPLAKDARNYDAITIAAVADAPDVMSAAIKLGGNRRRSPAPISARRSLPPRISAMTRWCAG